MSQQTVQASNEKMAVMVEDDDIVRIGRTTRKGAIDEEEASGILSVRSKGEGKEIKIDGVNYNIDVYQAAKISDLNSHSVPGPNLVRLHKETGRPEVKCLDSHKENTAISKESIYADKQNKSLQPRPESSVPPKKRSSPYHKSSYKTHDAVVRKDMREMKVKIDETAVFPTEELNKLLESVVKSCIQNKTIIKIDGEPHHLTATPVGVVEEHASRSVEDLYSGKIDRPPPGNNFVRNHGLGGELSDVDILEEEEDDINESYQTEDFTQNLGEYETIRSEFVYSSNVPPDGFGQHFNSAFYQTDQVYHNDEGVPFPCSNTNEQPLDLSYTSKTNAMHQLETEGATSVETEQMVIERAEVTRPPVFDDMVNSMEHIPSKPDDTTEQMVVNPQYLKILMALQHFERMKMNTPEPRDDLQSHDLLTTSNSQSQGSNTLNNIPENDQNTQQVAVMPNLASLDMTNSDGSVKESMGELIKRRLKNKLKNT